MEIETKKLLKAVKQVQKGDGRAFETLYNLTSKPAYFTALKIVKSVHDAEDVLQESYITVLDKINTLENPEAFTSWFNMIVANKSKEFLRKTNKLVFIDDRGEKEFDDLSLSDSFEENFERFSPGAGIEQQELKEQVMNLIDALSDEKRTVVLLYYYNELSIKQIAESLGLKEGTVKSRLYYAKEELARGITDYEKKYGKLLGIAPAAILIWALKATSVSTSAVFVASGAASATFAAITAHSAVAGSAVAGAAATGGGIAAKVIGFTAVQKAVAAAATMAIVGGAAGTTVAITNNVKENMPETVISETIEETSNPAEFAYEAGETSETAVAGVSKPVRRSSSGDITTATSIPTSEREPASVKANSISEESKKSAEKDTETPTTAVKKIISQRKAVTTKAAESFTSSPVNSAQASPETTRIITTAEEQKTSAKEVRGVKNSSSEKKTTAPAKAAESTTAAPSKTETTSTAKPTTTKTETAKQTTTKPATTKPTTTKPTTTKPTTTKPTTKPVTTAAPSTTLRTAAEPEPDTSKTQEAKVSIVITQGGDYADSVDLTLRAGDTFTFDDAKAAVEAKGYDTAFAEYSGAKLPLTIEADKTYSLTIDIE